MFRYWWPRVVDDVKAYVKTCSRCQQASVRFDKSAPDMHSIKVPSKPWSQIGVDLCSLPKSPVMKTKQHGVNLKLYFDRGCCPNETEDNENHNDASLGEPDSKKGRYSNAKISPPISQKPRSNCDDNDVEITDVEDMSPEFTFQPTQGRWRVHQTKRLNLPKPSRMERRLASKTLGNPDKIENVKGDGNCFFRAISSEMIGNEESHNEIRNAVVTFMTCRVEFNEFIGTPTHEYLNNSAMGSSGTWATDIEIIATATLLQTNIYVYATVSGCMKWLKHNPLFHVEGVNSFGESIYLVNSNDHFQRVVRCEHK
jgi:hypothetical protein